MEIKKFKCKDEVIYRRNFEEDEWTYGIFSHYHDKFRCAVVNGVSIILDRWDIFPYEGNEELVGTTDEPEIEISIIYGTELMALTKNKNWIYATLVSTHCRDNYFTVALSNGENIRVVEICRFSDFNPNDMEETRKHILTLKNGRIIRYKG